MKSSAPLVTISLFFTAIACAPAADLHSNPDPEAAREALLAVHEAGNRAHFETDVAALLENAAEEFVAVSNGQIYRQTKADVEAFFTDYLNGAVYSEYADIEPPIVRVSVDGNMGWIISRLRASRAQPDAEGIPQTREFIYAGIMLYEKQDGKWLRVANVSTFE